MSTIIEVVTEWAHVSVAFDPRLNDTFVVASGTSDRTEPRGHHGTEEDAMDDAWCRLVGLIEAGYDPTGDLEMFERAEFGRLAPVG